MHCKHSKMYKQAKKQTQAFRFRRFCRAGWAAYSSMHREVTIGRLAVRVADSSLAKGLAATAVAIVLAQGAVSAQSDKEAETRSLPEVQVTMGADTLSGAPEPAAVLTAQDFQQSNIRSIGDLVALLPGVDLRVRGGGDVQGDISMRGGTFDQMLVLLGGVNLTDAQTGHHTMDIPIDITMVERVELLTPAQLLSRGIVAFCGAVNIVVCEEYRDRLLADVSGGSYGSGDASLLATTARGPWALTVAGGYHRSDGYRPNTDYRHGSLFLQAARHGKVHDLQLQMGGQMKGFGGSGFYSTAYPDQYEATRTLVASATDVFKVEGYHFRLTAYGRLHRDRFELFRDGYVEEVPLWYQGHNHHLGSLAGASVRVDKRLGHGEVVAGGDVRREGIWSNVLGLPDSNLPSPYTMSDKRVGTSLFGGYRYSRGRFAGEAVAMGLYNSRFGFHYALAGDASYRAACAEVYLSAARTFRLPTFTDLYYQSVDHRSNASLNAESSAHVELGTRLQMKDFRCQVAAYYRGGSQIIDWVRRPEEELWYSMNHTAVDAYGIDAMAAVRVAKVDIRASYSYCHVLQDAGEWVSGSALDYLRHRAQLSLVWHPAERLGLRLDATYRYREGRWVDADGRVQAYGGVPLVGAGVDYRLGSSTLYVEGYNLLDRQWRDHGGVPQPGISVRAGVRVAL